MSTGGKWLRTSLIWLILALALVLIFFVIFRPSSDTNSVNVSTILNHVKTDMAKGQKDTLSVSASTLTLTRGQNSTKEVANINDTFDITAVLKDNGIDYTNSQLLVLQYEPRGRHKVAITRLCRMVKVGHVCLWVINLR